MTDLSSPRLSWRRLGVLVRQLPKESATHRSVDPEAAAWTLEAHLLALAVDVANVGNWQRAQKKGASKPKQIPRPGVGKARGKTRKFGGAGMSIDDMRAKHEAMVALAEEVVTDGD